MNLAFLLALVVPFALASPLDQTTRDAGIVQENVDNMPETLQDEEEEPHPEEQEGLFEGDIELTEEQQNAIYGETQSRDTILGRQRLWPNNVMHYVLDDDLNDQAKAAIMAAMRHITDRTTGCINFAPRTVEPSYVRFFTGDGIGRDPFNREQRISIGRRCEFLGIAVHEILHSLGFFHEQSRIDRDDFVKIKFENIEPGLEYNFRKYQVGQASTLNLPYDYDSIMHYSRRAFSANGQDTIKTVDPSDQNRIGRREGLSKVDILQLKSLYSCSAPTQAPQTPPVPATDSPTTLPPVPATDSPTTMPPVPTTPVIDDPCSNFEVLDSADRSIKSKRNRFDVKTDDDLEEGWYRISGEAGNRMASRPPRPNRCGTYYPGWLRARSLPTQDEGPVEATVCFRRWRRRCWRKKTISVANCGNFFVYKLSSPPMKNRMRYCGGP